MRAHLGRDKLAYYYEISNIESIWAEIELPNVKPFLICSVYRPPSSTSEWIDLLEEEVSIAQLTLLDVILMGDFNILLFRIQIVNGLIWCRTLTFCNLFKNQHVSPKQAQL